MVEVQSMWPLGADSRFVFRKNFAKYELFKSNAVREPHYGAPSPHGEPQASPDPPVPPSSPSSPR